jgi:hypothetical protein
MIKMPENMNIARKALGKQGTTQKVPFHFVLALVFLLVLMPTDLFADEAEHSHEEKTHPHHHRHHAALFLGGTHADVEIETEGGIREESEDAFTVGVDYEYRVSPPFGVGGLVEYAAGDLETTILAGALFIHPVGGLKFVLAPGVEHEGDENEFLFRAGVYYDFFFGNFSIAPTISVDFVDGEEDLVYGISLGYGWH